jgi:hypothetical protein
VPNLPRYSLHCFDTIFGDVLLPKYRSFNTVLRFYGSITAMCPNHHLYLVIGQYFRLVAGLPHYKCQLLTLLMLTAKYQSDIACLNGDNMVMSQTTHCCGLGIMQLSGLAIRPEVSSVPTLCLKTRNLLFYACICIFVEIAWLDAKLKQFVGSHCGTIFLATK